ncbi:MAG: mechanosensitive ion channel family protein [Dehalococcoidia bacterium]|nr:mechanosensitive ion channel family protein [Dehalococcoidia bacterium]
MIPDFARGSPAWEALFAAIVFGASILVALLLHPALTRVVKAFTAKTKTTLDDLLLEAVTRPLFLFILVQGFFLALTTTTFLDRWQVGVNKAWVVFAGGVVIYGLQRVIVAVLKWYAAELAAKTKGRLDEKLTPLIRRFLIVVVYAIGGLLILDNIGVELSPLLAGLGLGGLAVALALQPTLSNLIASAFMVADGSLAVGEFIEVQGGPSGAVVDVGWRSTKIRTATDNLVVIPNSKLADSIVTNLSQPTPDMNIWLNCGVSYESDLDRVQAVALDEVKSISHDLPEDVVDKAFAPVIYFREFGESNITFLVVMRARNRPSTFTVQHEMVKRLHARFAKEGIEISYPVRKLVLLREDGAKPLELLRTSQESASRAPRHAAEGADGGANPRT